MATYTVTNLNDSGAGSLREAIGFANSAAAGFNGTGADTITFAAGLTGTIALEGGAITIAGALDLVGPGADKITLQGRQVGGGDRIFLIDDPDPAHNLVKLSGLTLTKGASTDDGGAIHNSENLTLDSVAITNSTTNKYGGGVYTASPLTVINSTFSGNEELGPAAGGGGAIGGQFGRVDISNTTFYANKARAGGAVLMRNGGSINTSTFIGNEATTATGGGAIAVSDVAVSITNSIISGNTATTASAILALGGVDATVTYSLVSGTTTGTTFGAGNITGATADAYVPGAATLFKGRGIFVPPGGSAAVNAGDPAYTTATTPTTDERGYVRVVGARIDMGAVESASAPPTTYSIANVTAAEGDVTRTLDFTVTRNDTTVAATVDFTTADGSAKAGSDYVAQSGTASFAIGAATATISITVNGEGVFEPDETFTVTLSNPSGGGSLGTVTATGTIANDDPPPIPSPPPTVAPAVNVNAGNVLGSPGIGVNAPLATVTTLDGKVVPNPILEQQKAITALIAKVDAGALTLRQAQDIIVDMADGTTSVASMTYQFFMGKLPTKAGLSYLVSSSENVTDLNDGYYAGMSLENRYINMAVNLGKLGEGRADFTAKYGGLSLTDAATKAYTDIFGPPASGKIAAILTPERSAYFLTLGGDALGQKAAMVGWLLGEAAKSDLGPYAARNENFLYDLLDGIAAFGADAHVYDNAGPITVGLVGMAGG